MLASAILCAGLLLAQDASTEEKNKQELENLQGEWVLTSQFSRGKKVVPKPDSPFAKFTIKGNEIIFPLDKSIKATFKIDASKDPKWFDETNEGRGTRLLIYKLEGDSLTICTGRDGVRPTDYKVSEDVAIRVFKRAEK